MEEQRLYREYLREQYEEEKRRERELDKIMDEEVEKQFQKRLNQWREAIISRKLLSDGWINIIKNQIAREQEENKAQEKKSINESK